jgi:hypothetical protein
MSRREFNQVAREEGASWDADYEMLGEEFMDCCYWDETLKQKMREIVTPRNGASLTTRQTEGIIDLAWFENPSRPFQIPQWDEAAKAKMRQPVTHGGTRRLDDHEVRNLIELAGS